MWQTSRVNHEPQSDTHRRAHSQLSVVREAASQILLDRAREPKGLSRTLAISLSVHLAVIGVMLFGPTSWLSEAESESVGAVMSIRLGGPEGPGEGGLTPLGARPIQEVLPLEEARRPQWIQPPTPTPPKMMMPIKEEEEVVRRPEPETEVETAPDEARGRKPIRGPELLEGTAMADTGVEGIGVGLSTGGLGGSGAELSVSDFCCPEYLATMIELIRRQWDSNQQVPGSTVVRFSIERSGAIEDVAVDRESGYFGLDMSAQRAIFLTRQLPPLPGAFTESRLTVRLTFEYRR